MNDFNISLSTSLKITLLILNYLFFQKIVNKQTKPQNICAMCLCHTHQNILTQAHFKKKLKKKATTTDITNCKDSWKAQ